MSIIKLLKNVYKAYVNFCREQTRIFLLIHRDPYSADIEKGKTSLNNSKNKSA